MPQYLSVTDDHLSKRPAFFVIAKRFNNPVERKHAIYDRLQPIYGDGSIHGNELSAIASKNDAERGYGIVEQIDVDLGREEPPLSDSSSYRDISRHCHYCLALV